MPTENAIRPHAVVIGAGPAGLMAAEILCRGGVRVDVYDAMPSPGRKFLLAGVGGMNLTHAETYERFIARYGAQQTWVAEWLTAFGPDSLRAWASELGIETFVGSSGRVFPLGMKAAPLLRAWLQRLRASGVRLHVRQRWLGWTADGALRFAGPHGEHAVAAHTIVLALGGGSWARLGSDGAWVPLLGQRGVQVASLQPSNCGFDVRWSERFKERFAGHPVKAVSARCVAVNGHAQCLQGEFVVTRTGVEGGLVYTLSAPLRERIEQDGGAALLLDLAPGQSAAKLAAALRKPRGSKSLTDHLRRQTGITGVKAGLLREYVNAEDFADPAGLAAAIKSLPLELLAPRPLDEAISSAGGVCRAALDDRLMLRAVPGVFCAGEMLDWDAPTGGYLLTACFASGHAAGRGALAWLDGNGERVLR